MSGEVGELFRERWKELAYVDAALAVHSEPYREGKDRYRDVTPLKSNRVVLSDGGYINASPIQLESGLKVIATQAPIPGTIEDFRKMLEEQSVRFVFTLQAPSDISSKRIHPYWTDKGEPILGGAATKSALSANTTHVLYNSWPDFGVPADPARFQEFAEYCLAQLVAANPLQPALAAIHCSAGVGRTGCFTAVLELLNRKRLGLLKSRMSEHEAIETAFRIVQSLKNQRRLSVQTKEQFSLIVRLCLNLSNH